MSIFPTTHFRQTENVSYFFLTKIRCRRLVWVSSYQNSHFPTSFRHQYKNENVNFQNSTNIRFRVDIEPEIVYLLSILSMKKPDNFTIIGTDFLTGNGVWGVLFSKVAKLSTSGGGGGQSVQFYLYAFPRPYIYPISFKLVDFS